MGTWLFEGVGLAPFRVFFINRSVFCVIVVFYSNHKVIVRRKGNGFIIFDHSHRCHLVLFSFRVCFFSFSLLFPFCVFFFNWYRDTGCRLWGIVTTPSIRMCSNSTDIKWHLSTD
ncbi:hypothetical protein BZA77DRAFT_123680 [Pyronema omphalodes]|nr:hypothetical protein BZA77DRAFT_123680 [Pyronema omphalodes]